ncbi:MAG: alpha/beta hydrolase [Ignavibacteriae bacterium]|nr:alpha/beta hydrolase [Ignavibacteriota bacterium]
MTPGTQTQFATVNGIRLAYYDWQGERGPLVCIHSITGHKGTFTALAEQLAPQYRVVALDLRGRCDSDKPESGYGFAYHARDIIAFADAMGFEKFTLVGHSFGATASVYTAALHPSRVSSLVLLDGGADPKHETLKAMYPTVKRLSKTYQSLDEYIKGQRAITYHKPWTQALERYVSEEMQTDGVISTKSSPTAIEHDLDMHFWDNVWYYLTSLKCPALYLRPKDGLLGNTGHVYSDAEAAKLAEQIPNCRYEIVSGGNHYTFVIQDEPPVSPFIKKFLAEQYA